MSITKQLLGKVMVTNRGEYNSSTNYEILDIVSYNGSSYISKGNDNTDLPTNSNSWQLIAQKGDTYEVNETDIKNIAKQITDNANSEFNTNVNTKLKEYNDNAKYKTDAYDTNASDKLEDYNKNHTDKLSVYNSNATEKLNDYNNNVNTKLKEYNDNAETKVSEFNSTTNVQKITNLSNEFYRVKDEVLETGEVSDSYIHLEDSAIAELQELSIDGVCEQTTTTGSQLYNINTTSIVSPYVSKTNDDWITVSASNTTSNTMYLNIFDKPIQKLKTSTNYTIVCEIKSLSNTGDNKLFATSAATSYIGQFTNPIGYVINTLTNNSILINVGLTRNNFTDSITGLRTFVSIQPGGSLSITFRLSVLESLDITSSNFVYEKYTGYQPSPSPDYSQNISVLTGDIKLTSCNKNLFDGIVEDGSIDGQTGENINSTTIARSVNYIPVEENKQYIFSINNVIKQVAIFYYDKNYNFITTQLNYNTPFTPVKKSKYIRIRCFQIDYALFTTGNIQIEQGTTVTPFEEHLETQITIKLPEGEFIGKFSDTNKDYVSLEYNKEEGQYHVVTNKYIGKGVLNGTEPGWGTSGTTVSNKNRFANSSMSSIMVKPAKDSEVASIISNKLVSKSAYDTYDNVTGISVNAKGTIYIYYDDIANYTTEEFKNWLSANQNEFYYLLATPYKIDLGPIDMPLSYDEVANIFTDSDLLPTINVKYYRNFITTIQNLQVNNDTLKNELSNIESRLTALENANTSAVDNNPTEESEVTE